MKTGAIVEINLKHLQDNFARVDVFAPRTKKLAMVKANAYGHGLLACVQALPNADAFGVARLSEAETLRAAGVDQRIVLMSGVFDREGLMLAGALQCDLVLHDAWQLALLEAAPNLPAMNIWLKINTGMNRLGISPNDATAFYRRLEKLPCVRDIIVMTHLSDADDPANPKTMQQYKRFQAATRELSCPTSVANSAAIIAFPETHGDWVRPGIMLYGSSPLRDKLGEAHGLKPVMTVKSVLMAIRDQEQGDEIGYGSRYICDSAKRVGIVALGYGDGYPRGAKGDIPVLVQSRRSSVLGRVSMDMLAIDLSGLSGVNVGDEVTFWGEGLPAERVANAVDTITYELFTHIAPRQEHILRKQTS